jgi:hypothetical protein
MGDWVSEKEMALQCVSLSKGEKIFGTGRCSYELIRHTWKKGILSTQKIVEKEEMRGYLSFTNYRLLFLQKRGILDHSYHCRLSLDYEKIAGISSGGWAFKYISVTDDSGIEHRFGVSGDAEKIEGIKANIRRLVEAKRNYLERKEKAGRVQVTIDFSFLKSIAEKGGIVLNTLSCPYCNGVLEVPSSGNIMQCIHCGRKVYAIDVFEKMKSVLGSLLE